jgi:hypothetical protein
VVGQSLEHALYCLGDPRIGGSSPGKDPSVQICSEANPSLYPLRPGAVSVAINGPHLEPTTGLSVLKRSRVAEENLHYLIRPSGKR